MKEASIHAIPFLEIQPSNFIPPAPSPPKQKSILCTVILSICATAKKKRHPWYR